MSHSPEKTRFFAQVLRKLLLVPYHQKITADVTLKAWKTNFLENLKLKKLCEKNFKICVLENFLLKIYFSTIIFDNSHSSETSKEPSVLAKCFVSAKHEEEHLGCFKKFQKSGIVPKQQRGDPLVFPLPLQAFRKNLTVQKNAERGTLGLFIIQFVAKKIRKTKEVTLWRHQENWKRSLTISKKPCNTKPSELSSNGKNFLNYGSQK